MTITVSDAPERERFEARDGAGELVGYVTYQLTGTVIAYTHTHVLPGHEGQGIGGQLAQAVMDDARARSRTVVPICPYLGNWLSKRPEYDRIVAPGTRKLK